MLTFKKIPPFNLSNNRQMRTLIARIKKAKLGVITYQDAGLEIWNREINESATQAKIDISKIGTKALKVERLMKQYYLASDFFAGDAINQMANLENKPELNVKDDYVYFYSPELREFIELGNQYHEIMLTLVMLINRVADMRQSWIFDPSQTKVADVMQRILHLNEINQPKVSLEEMLNWKIDTLKNQYVWHAHGSSKEEYMKFPLTYVAKACSVRKFLELQAKRFNFCLGKDFKDEIPEINEEAIYLLDNSNRKLKYIGMLTDSNQKWLAHFIQAINNFVEEKDDGYYYYYGIYYDQIYSLLEFDKKAALKEIKRSNDSNETGRGYGGMARGFDEKNEPQANQEPKVELTTNYVSGERKLSRKTRNHLTMLLRQVKKLPIIVVQYKGEADLSTLKADQIKPEMFFATKATLGEYFNGMKMYSQEIGLWTGYQLNDALIQRRKTADSSQHWLWYNVNDESQLYLFNADIYKGFALGTTLPEVKHQLRQHFTNLLADMSVKKTEYCCFLEEDITKRDAISEVVARNRAKKQRTYQLEDEFEWSYVSETTIHVGDPSYGHFLELNQTDIKLLSLSQKNTEITVSVDPIAQTLTCYFPNYAGKINPTSFTEDAHKWLVESKLAPSDYPKTRTVSFNPQIKINLETADLVAMISTTIPRSSVRLSLETVDLVALGIENPLQYVGKKYGGYRYYDLDGGRIIYKV